MPFYFKIGDKYFTGAEQGGAVESISERDIIGRRGSVPSGTNVLDLIRREGDIRDVDPSQIRFQARSEIDKYSTPGVTSYDISDPVGGLGRINNLAQAQALGITLPTALPQGQLGENQTFSQYLGQTGQQFSPQTGFSGSAQVPSPNVSQQQILAGQEPQALATMGQTQGIEGVYRDNANNFYVIENGQRRHIELPEFQSLGLNEKFVKPGTIASLEMAKTGREETQQLSPQLQTFNQGLVTTAQLPQQQVQQQQTMQGQVQKTDDLISRIMSLFMPSDREGQLEQQLSQLQQSKELGLIDIESQNIPQQIISSQQNLLERQAQVKISGLQNELQRLQGNRTGQLNAMKFAYDINQDNVQQQMEFYKMSQPENIYIDKEKGQVFFRNPISSEITRTDLPGFQPEQPGLESGVVGEYQYYAQQEQAQGKTPLSFDAYQTRDANRKAQATNSLTQSINEMRLQLMQKELVEGKPPTDAQRTLATFASRLEQAIPTLEKLQDPIKNMNLVSFESQIRLPAALQSANIQQYMQASRNMINAILRRESGAVISPTEFSEARQQYLPQPGDSLEVLAQKKSNRDLVFASYRSGSGNAYQSLGSLIGGANIEDLRNKYNY